MEKLIMKLTHYSIKTKLLLSLLVETFLSTT